MRRSKYESLIILITTLVVAGLPRLFNLGQFITGDELLWLERSRLFFHALQDGSWPTTYLSGHPGVTTMWLGSAGWTIVEWLHPGGATSGALTYDDPHIIIILPYLRIPIAIVTACCIATAVQIVYRLFGALVGWLAMLMLALDPFYLAHSRTLHQDALTASFSLLFILCLLAYLLYRRSLGYLLFSAIAAALATLSKTTALVFLPFWGTDISSVACSPTAKACRCARFICGCIWFVCTSGWRLRQSQYMTFGPQCGLSRSR